MEVGVLFPTKSGKTKESNTVVVVVVVDSHIQHIVLATEETTVTQQVRHGVVVVVVVVFTLKAVPISTQYFLTSVLVQLTRTPSVVTG